MKKVGIVLLVICTILTILISMNQHEFIVNLSETAAETFIDFAAVFGGCGLFFWFVLSRFVEPEAR